MTAGGATVRFDAAGAEATRALGARLAGAVSASTLAARSALLITLDGDLGAGKTTFVSGMLQALGHAGAVRSPTYTLIEPYRFGDRDVQHCDLYRLRHPDELEDLGLRDLRRPGALLLVEWPEKADGRLGPADIAIRLRYASPESRAIEVIAGSDAGHEVLSRL